MIHRFVQFWCSCASLLVLIVPTPSLIAQSVVVDVVPTNVFTATATATNTLWTLDGVTVGTNSSFTYSPQIYEVGTHYLLSEQTLPGGIKTNFSWQARVRILVPTNATGYWTNFYVATYGNDGNDGSSTNTPFRTIDKARDIIRTLARPLPAGGVAVWVRGGTYVRTNTLMLTNANDSGTLTAPIVYRSYPGETAKISGGTVITNAGSFTNLSVTVTNRVATNVAPANLRELDLAAARIIHTNAFPSQFDQWITFNTYSQSADGGLCELLFNGQRMYLSRYPNHDLTNDDLYTTNLRLDGVAPGRVTSSNSLVYPLDSIYSLNYPGTYTNSLGVAVPVGGAFYYPASEASRIARWQTAITNGGLWLQGYWRVPWQVDGLKVKGLDTGNRVIMLETNATAANGIGDKFNRPAGSKAEPFWAVNLLEEIDQPGEWAVDFKRGKLYFWPPGAITNEGVVISDFGSPLVQIANRSNIVFQSLVFEAGLAQGIYITNGTRNLVLGCTFQNMGNHPVDIYNGGSNGVVSCDMVNLAGGGVLLRGGNESSNPRVPARNFVVNNLITNFSRVARVYAAAVDCGFFGAGTGSGGGGHVTAVGMRVAHNRISVSPHAAVLHASWDNVFEYNNISEFQQASVDLGAFYSYDYLYRHGNQTFRYNFVHDSPYGNGIDFDQDALQMPIYGNVMNLQSLAGSSQGYGVIYHNYNQDVPGQEQSIQCYNNLFANCRTGAVFVAPVPSVIQANAAVLCDTDFTWQQVVVGTVSNTFVTSSAASMQSGPNAGYAVDPGFINLAGNDLRLKPDAQVYADLPGFQQIPFEMMGLYQDEFRSSVPGYSPYVTTTSAANVAPTNAALQGWLYFPQFESNTTATVYWGTNDAGTNPLGWAQSATAGVFAAGPVSGTATGLLNGTTYFFRYYASNAFGVAWAPASGSFRTLPSSASPVPVITNVTPSLTLSQNGRVLLSGKVLLPSGPLYPPVGAPVYVSISGVTQGGTVTTSTGDFVVDFDTFGIPPSGPSYPVTYFYPGDPNLNTATNADTTVTLTPLPQPVLTTASRGVPQASFPLTGQVSASGPLYPAVGEPVQVTINYTTRTGSIIDTAGNFAVSFDFSGFPASTNPLPVTFIYPGSTNLSSATNSSTTVTICPASVGWTGLASTDFETGGGGGNWGNYPPPIDDLVSSTAVFSNTPPANQPSLTRSRSIEGLRLATSSGGWTLGSSASTHVLSLGGNGVNTTGQTSGTNRITAALDVAANQTWSVGTGGTLVFSSSITNRQSPGTNYVLTINGGGNTGTLILSPAAGSSINLTGTNGGAQLIQIKSGGTLHLGGDGTNAPVTTSTNTLRNSFSSPGSYGTWAIQGSSVVQANSGTWLTGDLGRNSTDSHFTGILNVRGATLVLAGARWVGGGTINISSGALKMSSSGFSLSNGGQFSPGLGTSGSLSVVNLFGGLLDLATATSTGGGNGIGFAISAQLNQSGGVFQNAVTAGSGTTTFKIGATGTAANSLSAVTLTGGTFISAGTVQSGGSSGAGNTNNFNFMGGTLAVDSYNATALGSSPTATATTNQTKVSVAVGTLANYGGTLAPGHTNTPGRTVITGNYAVSNNAAVLAIDIGGTTQASAFTNAANRYDFVSVSGTAVLGGSLNVRLINSYTPLSTSTFTLLTASDVSGAFTNLINNRVAVASNPTYSFLVVTTATSLVLSNYLQSAPSVTVSPSSVALSYGTAAQLTANLTAGLNPVSYQWYDNTTNALGSATNATLPLAAFGVAASGNYRVIVTNPYGSATGFASVTITTTNLAITAADDSKVYGTTRTYGAGSTAFTSVGLQNSETVGSVTLTADGGTNALDAVGNYPLTASAATGGTFSPANYNIAYLPGVLTVLPRPMTVTASSTNKVYGTLLTFDETVPSADFAVAGLVGGDSVTSVSLTSVGATNTAPVAGGPYAIVVTNAVGSGLSNYTIGYVNGLLTVNKAPTAFELLSSAAPIGYLDSVFFTATNLPPDATSNVVFQANDSAFSTNTVVNGGAVSLAVTNLSAGTNVITAFYGGDSNYLDSSNSLTLVVTNSAAQPVFVSISLSGTNLVFSGTNGTAGNDYWVLAATNLVSPPANWAVIATNQFDGSGNFRFTNPVAPADVRSFFRLRLP